MVTICSPRPRRPAGQVVGHHLSRQPGAVGGEAPRGEMVQPDAVANPDHRFTQEVGGAAGGVGPALPQPGHQHVAGTGGDGQQRIDSPGLAGVAPVSSTGQAMVAGALLGQAVGLADGRIEVDGEWRVAGSRPGLPGPGQQLTAHPVQLADVAPPEAAQERPQSLPSRKRGVEGALTMHPSTEEVRPARSAAASSMQPPPASAEATSVSILSPAFARPSASPRSR